MMRFWCFLVVFTVLLSAASITFAQPDGRVGTGVDCPSDIYFYVNSTEDSKREIFIRLPADSLDMCINLCYGNQFCFSTIYQPENTDKECGFSYHSAYNCTRLQLVTSYNDTGSNQTIVECLRCPSIGDLIWTNFTTTAGVDFTESTTEAGVINEETTAATTSGGQEVTTALTTAASATTTAYATTEANTTLAVEVTTLESTEAATTTANAIAAATTEASTNATAAATTEAVTNETTTAGAAVIDAGDQSATKSSDESVATTTEAPGVVNCSAGEIRALWETTDVEKTTNFSSHREVDDAEMCAIHCYAQGCVRAGYESNGDDSSGVCLLSFDEDDGENCTALISETSRVTWDNANINSSTITLYCVACFLDLDNATETTTIANVGDSTSESSTAAAAIDAGVQSATKSADESVATTTEISDLNNATETTTTASAGDSSTENSTTCDDLSFVIVEPSLDNKLGSVNSTESASSAKECASKCYDTEGCIVAGFQPIAEGSNLSLEGICLMSTDELSTECSDDDESVKEYTDSENQPSLIHCIKCGSYKRGIVKLPKSDIDFNLEIPDFISTKQPLIKTIECYSCISDRPCNTGVCAGSYCVVQAQRNNLLGITVISHTCGLGEAIQLKSGCHLISVDAQTTLTCVCSEGYCNNGDRISEYLVNYPSSTLSRILSHASSARTEKATETPLATTTPSFESSTTESKSQAAVAKTTTSLQTCDDSIIFTVTEIPSSSAEIDRLGSVSKVLLEISVTDCAARCYQVKCLQAHYISKHRSCFLSHETNNENYCDKVSPTKYVDRHESSSIQNVVIRCVSCGRTKTQTELALEGSTEVREKEVDLKEAAEALFGLKIRVDEEIPTEKLEIQAQDCKLSFEATMNRQYASLVLKNSTLVENVNECARNCYDQECQLAEFSPALATQGSSKAYCYLYTSNHEICDPNAERLASFAKYQRTLIKCLKCDASDTITAALTWAAERAETSTAKFALKIGQEQSQGDTKTETPFPPFHQPTSKKETATWAYFPDACVVTFEVSFAFKEFIDNPSRFINSTTAKSAALCAQICYQSGCIAAGYNSQVGSCLMAFGINEQCSQSERKAIYSGSEQIVLQCLRCGYEGADSEILDINYTGILNRAVDKTVDQVKNAEAVLTSLAMESSTLTTSALATSSSSTSTPTTSTSTSPTTRLESASTALNDVEPAAKIHENDVDTVNIPDYRAGSSLCVVTFEVAEIDATLGLIFKNGSHEPGSTGECAQRCYQDGCTLAGWDPISRYCFFYYGNTEHCAQSRRYTTYKPEWPIWMQCLRCARRAPRVDDSIPSIATTRETTTTVLSTTTTIPHTTTAAQLSTTSTVGGTTTVPETTTAPTTSTTPPEATTTVLKTTTSVATTEQSTSTAPTTRVAEQNSETTTSEAEEQSTVGVALKVIGDNTETELQSINREAVQTTTGETTVSLSTSKQIFGGTNDTWEPSILSKPCPLNLTFELSLIRYLSDFRHDEQRRSRNTGECAQTCYEAGCTIAGYIPATGLCMLSFAQEACYDKARRFSKHVGTEVVRLDCIRCGGDGSGKTLTILNSAATRVEQRLDSKPRVIQKEDSSVIFNTHRTRPEGTSVETGLLRHIRSGSACSGRLVFQALAVNSLPKINVTNDVFARSPADCAKKCWDIKCTTAGFIPNPAHDGGVCLLSRDPGMCITSSPLLAQYGDLRPFVISCITCSACNYSLGLAIPTSVLAQLNVQTDAASMTECAVRCQEHNCTAAAYSDRAPAGNCLLSTEGKEQCDQTDDLELNSQESLPLKLDCVQCEID